LSGRDFKERYAAQRPANPSFIFSRILCGAARFLSRKIGDCPMKKCFSTAVALALSTASAFAADLPSIKGPPPAPPPPPMWTGFYVGLNAGGTWSENNKVDVISAPLVVPPMNQLAVLASAPIPVGSAGGFIGGGQIGYNRQFGSNFVAGFEADIQGAASSGGGGNVVTTGFIAAPVITTLSAKKNVDYLGTVRGRMGWLFTPTLLVYGTGGLAYGGANAATTVIQTSPGIFTAVAATRFSDTQVGWTVGGGLEWMFMPNWSAKVEYLYYDLGRTTNFGVLTQVAPAVPAAIAASRSSARFDGHIVRAGLNYHFCWGEPAPVIASY
jgi:outer membrane immunogenic protein